MEHRSRGRAKAPRRAAASEGVFPARDVSVPSHKSPVMGAGKAQHLARILILKSTHAFSSGTRQCQASLHAGFRAGAGAQSPRVGRSERTLSRAGAVRLGPVTVVLRRPAACLCGKPRVEQIRGSSPACSILTPEFQPLARPKPDWRRMGPYLSG